MSEISVMPFAAYSRDHIFVVKERFRQSELPHSNRYNNLQVKLEWKSISLTIQTLSHSQKTRVKIEEFIAIPYPDRFRVKVNLEAYPISKNVQIL